MFIFNHHLSLVFVTLVIKSNGFYYLSMELRSESPFTSFVTFVSICIHSLLSKKIVSKFQFITMVDIYLYHSFNF